MDASIFASEVISLSSVYSWTELFKDRSIVIIGNKKAYICLLKNDENKTIEYFCPKLTPIPLSITHNIEYKHSNYSLVMNIHKYQHGEHTTSYKHCILRCFYFLQDIEHNHFHMMNHLTLKSRLSYDELIEKLVL